MTDHARARDFIGAFWARTAIRGSLDGAARNLPANLIDVALVGSSLVAAVGAVAFAGSMLMQRDPRPKVNGLQYLAIFAQPRGAAKADPSASSPKPPSAPPNRPVAMGPLDMSPFGSIGAVAPVHSPIDLAPLGSIAAAAATGASGFALVAAQPDLAWLRQQARIFAVRPGDMIPGLGRVKEIALRGGQWALIDEAGASLLSGGAPELGGASSARAAFARPMIFGADK